MELPNPEALYTSGLQRPEDALRRDFSPCPAEPGFEAAKASGKPAQGWQSCHEMLRRPGAGEGRELVPLWAVLA